MLASTEELEPAGRGLGAQLEAMRRPLSLATETEVGNSSNPPPDPDLDPNPKPNPDPDSNPDPDPNQVVNNLLSGMERIYAQYDHNVEEDEFILAKRDGLSARNRLALP